MTEIHRARQAQPPGRTFDDIAVVPVVTRDRRSRLADADAALTAADGLGLAHLPIASGDSAASFSTSKSGLTRSLCWPIASHRMQGDLRRASGRAIGRFEGSAAGRRAWYFSCPHGVVRSQGRGGRRSPLRSRGTTVSAETISGAAETPNLKQFIYKADVPVVVGGCRRLQPRYLMRTGMTGISLSFGGGAAAPLIQVPWPAVADNSRRDYMVGEPLCI